MKQKYILSWLKNTGTQLCVLLFMFLQVTAQGTIFAEPLQDYSFDASKTVVQAGAFHEIRQTSDGHLVHRFFTGLETKPYQDYLLLEGIEGKKHFIPLREETSFFTEHTEQPLQAAFIQTAALTEKKVVTAALVFAAILIVALCSGYVSQGRYILLSSVLSRIKNSWLFYRNIVFSTA